VQRTFLRALLQDKSIGRKSLPCVYQTLHITGDCFRVQTRRYDLTKTILPPWIAGTQICRSSTSEHTSCQQISPTVFKQTPKDSQVLDIIQPGPSECQSTIGRTEEVLCHERQEALGAWSKKRRHYNITTLQHINNAPCRECHWGKAPRICRKKTLGDHLCMGEHLYSVESRFTLHQSFHSSRISIMTIAITMTHDIGIFTIHNRIFTFQTSLFMVAIIDAH